MRNLTLRAKVITSATVLVAALAITAAGWKSSHAFTVEGMIYLPAIHAAAIPAHGSTLVLRAFSSLTVRAERLKPLAELRISGEQLLFPYHYSLDLPAHARTANGKNSLYLTASLCGQGSCDRDTAPQVQGYSYLTVNLLPGNTHPRPLPDLILTRLIPALDLAKCHASGRALRGLVVKTPEFIRDRQDAREFTLIALPQLGHVNKEGSNAQFARISFGNRSTAKFELPLPTGYENEFFQFFAVRCRPGEGAHACGQRAMPVHRTVNTNPKMGTFHLIPKGLRDPRCGDETPVEFYLHNWSTIDMGFSHESLDAASAPEKAEGLHY